jgi:PhzF family phenazine biosynthesis protein
MRTYIVDSFTDKPFSGNPAGVCLADSLLGEDTMQDIAKELGLSETAFVTALEDPETFHIRFFSPKMEIALCGHATLASAKVLFTGSGLKTAHFINIDELDLTVKDIDGGISLEFPVYHTEPADAPPALLDALQLNAVRNAEFNTETGILLLETGDPREIAALNPDFETLRRSHDTLNGVVVTASSGDDGYDFHSRYFWPWSGTDEDPVTGSTHTFLTTYWAKRLHKKRMRSFQSSRRSGFMQVELTDDKVLITGQAVIVLKGMIDLPAAA